MRANPRTAGRVGAGGWLAVALPAVLALVVGTTLTAPALPGPRSARAPADAFSAERALVHVERLAERPRPVGSRAHAAAADYLVETLTALGLDVMVQEGVAASSNWSPYRQILTGAAVRNVVARLPGTDPSGTVGVVSHYDSVPGSPGASDSGAALAAILETVRALGTAPPLRNDLVVVFTDGEEVGLLGVRAFLAEHPWAREIDLVLNFDARGTGGPVWMFETSGPDLPLLREFAEAAPHPVGNSFASAVYERMPNLTDFTVFAGHGVPGLNFAFIEGATAYHAATDTPANLSAETLQQLGENCLALVRGFGSVDLATLGGGGDAVFFDLFGKGPIVYPAAWAPPLAAAAVLLYAALLAVAARRGQAGARGMVTAVLLFLGAVVAAPVAVLAALWAALRLDGGFAVMPFGPTYNSPVYYAAFSALTVAVVATVYALGRRRVTGSEALLGPLGVLVTAGAVAAVALPGASYLLLWPTLTAGLALLPVLLRGGFAQPTALAVSLAGAVPAVLLFVPWIDALFVGLTVRLSMVVVVFLALLLGFLAPHLRAVALWRPWALPTAAALLAVALWTTAVLRPGFDHDHPQPDSLFYAFDGETGEAVWASLEDRPDRWTRTYLGASPGRRLLTAFTGATEREYLSAPAPVLGHPSSTVEVLEASPGAGGGRRVRIRVRPAAGALGQRLEIDATGQVRAVEVAGERFSNRRPGTAETADQALRLLYFAAPPEGFEVALETAGSTPVELNLVDLFAGLPPTVERRPAGLMPRPDLFSETTMVRRLHTF